MPEQLEPLRVERVDAPWGSAIEPPLDQDWPALTRLAWTAGVAHADSGIRLTVGQFARDEFTVMGYPFGSPVMTFDQAWRYIANLSIGAQILRRQTEGGSGD